MDERQNTIECIFDVYKSVHGFKPRHVNFHDMSGPELGAYLEELGRESEIALEQEEIREAEAFGRLQNHLDGMVADNGIDFDTAIRWEMQAHNTDDIDYWLWCWGIGFNDLHHFKG